MTDWAIVIPALTALLSALAAVLAWAAKLWWGREYAAAKDETIRAKEAQIETLRLQLQELKEFTPMKIREYFLSTKQQLEEFNDKLGNDLQIAQSKISALENRVEEERSKGESNLEIINQLETDMENLVKSEPSHIDYRDLERLIEYQHPLFSTDIISDLVQSFKDVLKNFRAAFVFGRELETLEDTLAQLSLAGLSTKESLEDEKLFDVRPVQSQGENIFHIYERGEPLGLDHFFVKVHFNLWTKHALNLINIDLAYDLPEAMPGPQKIAIDSPYYEPLDGSYRMTRRKPIAAGSVIDIFVSRDFVCNHERADYADYGRVTVKLEVSSPAWAGIRTLVITGKLEPGGRFEVSREGLQLLQ